MSTNQTRVLPNNERRVEIPYLLNHVRGKTLLDVGKDRDDYYTSALKDMGIVVTSCDPWDGAHADYTLRFEDLRVSTRFDTILFLSSLEHFAPNDGNLSLMHDDIAALNKCRDLLNPDGRIILTVPYGKERIYYDKGKPDFIQWSDSRVWFLKHMTGLTAEHEMVMRWKDGEWIPVIPDEWRGLWELEYRSNGAMNASAVYMATWRF